MQQRILIPEGGAQRLAFGDGALWVGGDVDAPGVPKLSRIDPRTNEVTPALANFGNAFCCVVAGGGFVWGATTPDRTVWKIGEDGTVVAPIKLACSRREPDVRGGGGLGGGRRGRDGGQDRPDHERDEDLHARPRSAERRRPQGHHRRRCPAERAGRDRRAGRAASSTSRSARTTSTGPPPIRPLRRRRSTRTRSQFHYATCAKLFNYPDASGAAGKRLAPEVAAAWPAVTDGGRTYTFRIRPGFRFSPPSGEPVTAESFRHAIERSSHPGCSPGPWSLAVLPDVVGARAFHAGKAAHMPASRSKGDRLVIHLVKPAPDLVTRLARPASAPFREASDRPARRPLPDSLGRSVLPR